MTFTQLRFLPILLFFLTGTALSAQRFVNNCVVDSIAVADLAGNGVRAAITPYGALWFDGNNGRYQVSTDDTPSADAPTAMYAGGLWLGGFDPGGNLKVAASEYGMAVGNYDYFPGPLTDVGIQYGECNDWNRLFPVTRAEIEGYLSNPTGPVPANMAAWPATGNPLFTDATGLVLPPDRGYAPFFDANADFRYDPRDGDYPLFCGDQAVFAIFNDAGNVHSESGTVSQIQAEIHLLAYSETDPSDSVLHRTTFYDYTVYNRAEEDIIDFYAGHWMDADLGCPENDLFNSIPEEQLFYLYNENGTDPEVCNGGITSYGNSAPATIIQVLRSTDSNSSPDTSDTRLASVMYINGGSGVDGPPGTTSPSTASEYYNYLEGRWRDGTLLQRQGDGYDELSGDETVFAFDGAPTPDGTPWKFCNEDVFPRDIRTVYATGPYERVRPGTAIRFTTAVTTIFGVPYDGSCPDETPIIAAADRVKAYYSNNNNGCFMELTSNRPVAAAELGLEVFPNPATDRITFRLPAGERIERVELFDATGRLVQAVVGRGPQLEVAPAAAGLRSGVYGYRLRTASGAQASGKVVIR